MLHPYQCLAVAKLADTASSEILFAACGHQIFTYDLNAETLLASWPIDDNSKDKQDDSDSSTEIITASKDPTGHSRKRRKTSKKKPADQDALLGAITRLLVSRNNRYVVATTGEDKLVYVFEIGQHGHLTYLSKRRMTKRPCAIAITPNDDFILVGDKFGDVYSLSLHFDEAEVDVSSTEQNGALNTKQPPKPSATDLTVHTKKNLMALKNQMLQKQTASGKAKDVMHFSHQHLLGHVSMLTDLLSVSVPSPLVQGVNREYIVTCDRDEHVRISRGGHQAHIIENYCFGHTQFVNKLCLLRPNVLASGGGDSHIFVWDWLKGRLRGQIPIQEAVKNYRASRPEKRADEVAQREDDGIDAIAVSGIWSAKSTTEPWIQVFCACEAIPAVFQFDLRLDEAGTFSEGDVKLKLYELPGNALDMAFSSGIVIVSVDNVHVAATTTSVRKSEGAADDCARLLRLGSDSNATALNVGKGEGKMVTEGNDIKKLNTLLYGAEDLRKRGGEDAE